MAHSDTILTADAYLHHLRGDTDRILDLLRSAPDSHDAPVPLCPGWTVRDAVEHTGAVFAHKVIAVSTGARPTDPVQWTGGPTEGQGLADWFAERRDALLDLLGRLEPTQPTWSWHEDRQDVGFWLRRMAQEAVVHRVDVESGTHVVSPVDDTLAVDGVDEVLDWFLVYQDEGADESGPAGAVNGTVAVRTGGRIWRLVLTPETVQVVREPGAADAVVSGEPSELLLWLWGRRPDSAVALEGDTDLLAGLRARLHVVTQ